MLFVINEMAYTIIRKSNVFFASSVERSRMNGKKCSEKKILGSIIHQMYHMKKHKIVPV